MLTEQRLRELEDSPWAIDRPPVTDKEFRLFIAAARVANAVARLERELPDSPPWWFNSNEPADSPVGVARADLARALQLYTTVPVPVEVAK